jgi:hypothetical protein
LLEELLAGSRKLSDPIFHFYQMKDNAAQAGMQEKNNKTSTKCLEQGTASQKPEEARIRGTQGYKKCKTLVWNLA